MSRLVSRLVSRLFRWSQFGLRQRPIIFVKYWQYFLLAMKSQQHLPRELTIFDPPVECTATAVLSKVSWGIGRQKSALNHLHNLDGLYILTWMLPIPTRVFFRNAYCTKLKERWRPKDCAALGKLLGSSQSAKTMAKVLIGSLLAMAFSCCCWIFEAYLIALGQKKIIYLYLYIHISDLLFLAVLYISLPFLRQP